LFGDATPGGAQSGRRPVVFQLRRRTGGR